jgi:hypothetical protein
MAEYFPIDVSSLGSYSGSFSGSFFGNGSGITGISASNAISASYAATASYLLGSIASASYALSASYAANGGVTQLLAGPNISLSPTNGLGQVTVSATLSGSTIFNTATGSYGSFYDTTTQTNPIANVPRSMSFNSTDITNGVSISGSTNPFNTYVKVINAGIYNIQFSAQVDKTDGGTDDIVIWLRKNGIDLTDTATTLTLPTNNSKVVAAWNWFVTSAAGDYYQIIWVSADTDLRLFAEPISGTHPGIPSVILTANRVDQFLSNTGSFSGSFNGSFTGSLFGTASWATNASTASFINTASTNAFVQNGNSFGATALLGTNDNQSLAFETSGSTRMFINSSSGNVGIGTTSSLTALDVRTSNNSTITPLSVAPNDATTLLVGNIGTNGVLALGQNNTGQSWIQSRSRLAGGSANPILLNPLGGNVLIGTTTDLGFKLIVSGGLLLTGSTLNAPLVLSDGNYIYGGGNTASTNAIFGAISTQTELYARNDRIGIWSGAGAGNYLYSVGGNFGIGIGANTPSARLQVRGSGTTSATTALRVENINASASLTIRDDGSSIFTNDLTVTGSILYRYPAYGSFTLNNAWTDAVNNNSISIYDGNGNISLIASPGSYTRSIIIKPSPGAGILIGPYVTGNGTAWSNILNVSGSSNFIGNTTVTGSVNVSGSIYLRNNQYLRSDFSGGVFNIGVFGVDTNDSIVVGSTYAAGGVVSLTSGVRYDMKPTGMGINTASPSAMLHVKGSGTTSATTALRVTNTNSSASLVVLDNSNIGFGTTTPSELLQINVSGSEVKRIFFSEDASTSFGGGIGYDAGGDSLKIFTRNGSTDINAFSISRAGYPTATNGLDTNNSPLYFSGVQSFHQIKYTSGIGLEFTDNEGMLFNLGNPSTGSVKFSSTGNVGIGKTSPTYRLDVSGSGNFTNGLTVTGSLIAPSITGSLQGTASWATNALTASYVNPLMQNVIITGSLIASGSSNGINTTSGILTRNDVTKVDWRDGVLYTSTGNASVDWENSALYDVSGNQSVDWNGRTLYTQAGSVALEYQTGVDDVMSSQLYIANITSGTTQRALTENTLYSGHIIQGTIDASVTAYDIMYLDTDGTWKPLKNLPTISTKMVGIEVDGYILLEGDMTVSDDGSVGTYVVSADHGLPVYLSGTTGRLTTVQPASDVIRVVGHIYYQNPVSTNVWLMKFKSSNDWTQI